MKIVFISDFFVEHILGGGELNDHELLTILQSKGHEVLKIQSHLVTKDFIEDKNNQGYYFIISNFINLSPPCRDMLAKCRYLIYEHDHKYLKSRNITKDDILKYNIGYCDYGPYSDRIIIPSYDVNKKLNYFTSRTFKSDVFQKYKNPDVSRDIIPFELLINWDLPLIICEGPFDAIAIKRNAIPLLGKNIQPNLMKKIISSRVKKIYIALDTDALKQALHFCEILINEGKEVYLVELQGKDPSEVGFRSFTKLIQQTFPLNQFTLMEKKISLI